ncbi:hypothetical protein DJ030_14895 [bacterium endosymbiont of Escarpia laminata]|nr:MAG: hypothetical protein DJ030_14895 [bacterium endosymbiont of Escarpia laminata]
MYVIGRSSNATKGLLLFFSLFLTACDPSQYQKPAEDFLAATVTLRQVYFLEMDLSNKANIERRDLEDQIAIWGAPADVDQESIERVANKMTERRRNDIHEALKPLRKKAFAAIEGYAQTLVNLASGESTEAIVSELNGLVQGIEGVVARASKISALSDRSAKVAKLAGPLKQYAGILREIIGLVSDVVREQAIIQTIGRSNKSVAKLLSVLKNEAVTANNNTQIHIKKARENLEGFLKKNGFANADNISKALIAKRLADIRIIEEQVKDDGIDKAFDAALDAQSALVEKAISTDAMDWAIQIRAFKDRAEATKTAIEKIQSEI